MAHMQVFDNRVCRLGEGPLWHPLQKRWYWFDILNGHLLGKDLHTSYQWSFNEMVSAAGWIDAEHLLIASETRLFRFNTHTQAQQRLVNLEQDNPLTRSNDGRADPWGGFWIGTMGKQAQPQAGAIYRFYQGQLAQLYSKITISNALCFAHDKSCAYFTDTPTQTIMRQSLDAQGWPIGEASVHINLQGTDYMPDGAVVDAKGNLWNAQWGTGRVACYNPQGQCIQVLTLEAQQASCPAFGGDKGQYMMVTTAADGAAQDDALAGQCFIYQDTTKPSNVMESTVMESTVRGQQEYQVNLPRDFLS